jgi:hypothetical protein
VTYHNHERFPTVAIKAGVHGKWTDVSIDGQPIRGIEKMVVRIDAKDATRIYLRLLGNVEIEGPTEIENEHVGG